MNEKKFLKRINSKQNLSGSLTYTYVIELLDGSKKPAVIPGFFARFFKNNKQGKSAVDIIYDNFDEILDATSTYYKATLLTELSTESKLFELIKSKFGEILERFKIEQLDNGEIYRFFNNMYDEVEDKKGFIEDNYQSIIDNVSMISLFELKNKMLGFSMKVDDEVNSKFKENKYEFCKELITDSVPFNEREKADVTDKDLEDYSKTVAIIIEELLKSENREWIDIEKIGLGSFSNVYRIGEKVLKIGMPRMTYNTKNHKRILQPLARTNLMSEKSMKVFSCIEVSNYVDRINIPRTKDGREMLYKIYKELREDGINYTDIDFRNLGILRSENKPTLDNEDFEVNPEAVGFDKKIDEILNKGEIVILDTDYIFSDETPGNKIYFGSDLSIEFEKRYIKERAKLPASTLTKDGIRKLLIEGIDEDIEDEVRFLIAKFNAMPDDEFKEFIDGNETIADVEVEIREMIFKLIVEKRREKGEIAIEEDKEK